MRERDLEDVMAIGRRNQEILELARAWCKHARRDRGLMGVGIPEQMTGLPISGGSLACDYARAPTMYGLQLEHTAIEFYRRNCIGCKYHAPTGRIPNLKTWVDEVVARQEAEVREQAAAAAARAAERRTRKAQRRQVFGQLNAFGSEVIDLIERLDADEPDRTAGEDLIAEAQLQPNAFAPELIAMLEIDARLPRMSACIKALFELHRRTGQPGRVATLDLAVHGLREREAVDECADMVSQLAEAADAKKLEEVFEPLVEA